MVEDEWSDTDAAWADCELNERRRYEGDEMKFPAKKTSDFTIVPAGNHVGICNAVVDLGMQKGSGMYPAPKRQVYIRFELPSERVKYMKDDKEIEGPMSIGATMTASMSEKANLRKFIESWFGKKFPNGTAAADFDLKVLLTRRCLLNITHTDKGDKTYANIANATPLPKGMVSNEPQHNPTIYFSLDDTDQTAMDKAYDLLPEWLRKKIDERLPEEEPERNKEEALQGAAEDFNDDIPF